VKTFENQYKELVGRLMRHGEVKEGRNGRTKSMFATTLEIDGLDKGYFPLLTGRQMYYKGVLGELAAMLRGPTCVDDFEKFGCNYWGQWADDSGQLKLDYGNAWLDWNGTNQLDMLRDSLKNNPNDRRMLVTGWNPENLADLSLPCCHILYQWHVSVDGKLNMIWYQRSADTMVGIPSDAILAATWNILIANEVGLTPGKVTMVFGDTHIYEEHWDTVKDYLDVCKKLYRVLPPKYELIAEAGMPIEEFLPTMIDIREYKHGPKLSFEVKA
jgi:thymidylate synthase